MINAHVPDFFPSYSSFSELILKYVKQTLIFILFLRPLSP